MQADRRIPLFPTAERPALEAVRGTLHRNPNRRSRSTTFPDERSFFAYSQDILRSTVE